MLPRSSTRSGRLRSVPVHFEFASPRQSGAIFQLWSRDGEGNVDLREQDAVSATINECNLYVIRAGGMIVGTAGRYRYPAAPFVELGSSCIIPAYRGFGLADISLNLRVVQTCLNEPGTAIVSELYPESVKSASVLRRWGFELAFLLPLEMLEHAYGSNPERPVRHVVCPPAAVPLHAQNLLRFIRGADRPAGDIRFAPRFAKNFRFGDEAIRCAVERLADGELGIAGWTDPTLSTEEWLWSLSSERLLTYEQYLRQHC